MGATKEQLSGHRNVLGVSGLSGKSVTGLEVYRSGVVTVVEVNFAGGPQFIKVRGGQYEIGGTQEWGTGTQFDV